MSILEFDAPREHLDWDSSEGYIPPDEWTSKDYKFVSKTKDHEKVLEMVSHWNVWCPGGLLLESVSLELLLGPHGYEICQAAIATYGEAVKYIPAKVWESFTPRQVNTLCWKAVKLQPNAVKLFSEVVWKALPPRGSYAICRAAVSAYPGNLEHIPKAVVQLMNEQQYDSLRAIKSRY